jgi:glutaredoxin-related protein
MNFVILLDQLQQMVKNGSWLTFPLANVNGIELQGGLASLEVMAEDLQVQGGGIKCQIY